MTAPNHWKDDELERREFATFLYKFLCLRHSSQRGHNSVCCALDGEWGTGKTFFVDRWIEDAVSQQHIAIKYDAWKNDFQEDALLNFISHLHKEISPTLKKIPLLSPANMEKIERDFKATIVKAGEAALPLLISAGKNYALNKLGEEGSEEIKELLGSSRDIVTEKDVNKYLEKIFKNHETKSASIQKVRADLELLAQEIDKLDNLRGPIFIVIDELDRCRPTYAIALLEGIKHIINAKGICFLISTNITQLSESIKGVYGPNFDGRRYLRRFFEYEFELPESSNLAYITHLLNDSPLSNSAFTVAGLPRNSNSSNGQAPVAECISQVTTLFKSRARDIRQIIVRMETVLALQPVNVMTNITYLAALCCIDMRSDLHVEDFLANPKSVSLLSNPPSPIKYYEHYYRENQGGMKLARKHIGEVLIKYLELAKTDPVAIAKSGRDLDFYEHYSFQLASEYKNYISDYHIKIKRMTILTGQDKSA